MSFDPDAPDAFSSPARGQPRGVSLLGWGSRPTPHDLQLENWPQDELLALLAAVEPLLEVKSLKDMDLSRALVLQVLALQKLQNTVTNGDKVPVNQQAQVANSLSSALVNLVKLQNEIYTSERFKRVENALIEFINSLPDEGQKQRALELYELHLGAANA